VRGRAGRALLGQQRLGLEADARLHVPALRVDRVELHRDLAGAFGVGGEQQLEPGVGAVEPPGGVEPRREAEADRPLVDAAGVDPRDVHQRLQPGLACARQPPQPGADEPPVLAGERDDVGDRGERDQVEVLVDGVRALPRARHQRLRELVGDAGRAQVRAEVAPDPRVHDRGLGQRAVGARGVVVGDHDLHPGSARGGDLLDRGDRAVDRDQQLRPARGEALDRGSGQAVAVVDPARQVPVDVGPEGAQRAHEDRGRGDAVDVVVAVHGDPRAAPDVSEDHRGGVVEPAERLERMSRLGLQEAPRVGRIAQPAPYQHLREHGRDAQLAAQPLGGGVVVRSDLEAGVGAAHASEARAVGGRNRVWLQRSDIRMLKIVNRSRNSGKVA
jgi:hypothetical protein